MPAIAGTRSKENTMYNKNLNYQVVVRVSDKDFSDLEKLSIKRHIPMSKLIRYIISDYIMKNK